MPMSVSFFGTDEIGNSQEKFCDGPWYWI